MRRERVVMARRRAGSEDAALRLEVTAAFVRRRLIQQS
jgi:hypothetical protein